MVGLEYGASGHGRVVECECFFGVVDGLDFVGARWGFEEEVSCGAVEHFLVGWGTASLVDAEGVVYGDLAALATAGGECESWVWAC